MAGPKVVVTGSEGFIGKNLCFFLRHNSDCDLIEINSTKSLEESSAELQHTDVVFHLAGVNRPRNEKDFQKVNVDFTESVIRSVSSVSTGFKFVFASSIQAQFDNPYGRSKRNAEDLIKRLGTEYGFQPHIYRLPNVFGKWGKPNYNSVVTTFCYNISRNLSIRLDDPLHELPLVYIDDVIHQFTRHLESESTLPEVDPVYHITLGELANKISDFKSRRKQYRTPQFSTEFDRKLYATFLSYLPEDDFGISASLNSDDRGTLFELVKQESFGQIFVSTTKPGITRGNHYHNTKTEKFCVIKGQGRIEFRQLGTEKIISYEVDEDQPQIVDIPPGYTHNITNTGEDEMITLFWASEVFDKDNPDTNFDPV